MKSVLIPMRILLALAIAASVIGCAETEDPESAKMTSNMRGLAVAYGQFSSRHRGRPPKSEKELRAFIEKEMGGVTYAESYNMTSVDDLFISSRDNEPYEVIYGKKSKIVAYEKVGVDGKRFVAHDLGAAEEVDEATFAELVPNAK